MENKQTEYVRARATFTDKMKSGDDQITLILGGEDVNQLLEQINGSANADGIRLQVYLKPYDGKTLGSIKVSEGKARANAGAPAQAPRSFAPKAAATSAPVKKSFAFTKK